jgi:hypothetical protein
MKSSILAALCGIAVIAAVPASATTSGFDFTQCGTSSNYYGDRQTESGSCGSAGYSNTSNSFSETVTGIGTVTATAYTTGTGASNRAGTAITSGTNAVVGQYTGYGLGVCSIGDTDYSTSHPANGCDVPTHQVDDSGSYEFILFTFSTAVDISNITLANFGGGPLNAVGLSYWVDPSSLTTIPAGATTVLCGTSGAPTCPTSEGGTNGIGTGSWTTNLNGTSGLTDVTTLLVAADLNETDDYFKVQGLSVTDFHAAATPEPATFGMLGLALAGIGIYARKRQLS